MSAVTSLKKLKIGIVLLGQFPILLNIKSFDLDYIRIDTIFRNEIKTYVKYITS